MEGAYMDVKGILEELDYLSTLKQTDAIEPFLLGKAAEAMEEKDTAALLSILNELVTYYKNLGRYADAIKISEKILKLAEDLELEGSIEYGSLLLNVAAVYQMAERLEDARNLYLQVFPCFEGKLEKSDSKWGCLYHSMSVLYRELREWNQSIVCLKKALELATMKDCVSEVSVIHTKLAASYLQKKETETAISHLKKALKLYHATEENQDGNYGVALFTMGEAYYQLGQLDSSKKYYEEALQVMKQNVGEDQDYAMACEKYAKVLKELGETERARLILDKARGVMERLDLGISGMELCRRYYLEYGKPMIEEKFKEYADKIAVGLVGYGSECYGYDDEISRDHDFGPGFILWLTNADYQMIGAALAEEYEKLPKRYLGFERLETKKGKSRMGVKTIEGFYREILQTDRSFLEEFEYEDLDECNLSLSINGEVFRDDFGEFTRIRNRIAGYYNKPCQLKKIAAEVGKMSQSGQYNYQRMMLRNQPAIAQMAVGEFVTSCVHLIHLLNKKYTPFYKWSMISLKELPILGEVEKDLEELLLMDGQQNSWGGNAYFVDGINESDKKVLLMEKICEKIKESLQALHYYDSAENLLHNHVRSILEDSNKK